MEVSFLMSWLAYRFLVVDGLSTSIAQTGESYTIITHQGVKAEGILDLSPEDSERLAEAKLCQAIADFVSDKKGTLYWRTRPEVCRSGKGWAGYARLLISAKRMCWRTFADYAEHQSEARSPRVAKKRFRRTPDYQPEHP